MFMPHNEFRIADIAHSKTSYSWQKIVTRLELETLTQANNKQDIFLYKSPQTETEIYWRDSQPWSMLVESTSIC